MFSEQIEKIEQTCQALEKSAILEYNRRDFLTALGIAGLTLTGCSKTPVAMPTPRVITPSFPEGAEVPGARERFILEVYNLPESPVKALLIDRSLPYYQGKPPFVLNRSGLSIVVHAADITALRSSLPQVNGSITLREAQRVPKPRYTVESASIKIPIPGLINEGEAEKISPDNLAEDRTLLAQFTFTSDSEIFTGVYPKINIIAPYQEILANPDVRRFYGLMESFAYVKEACSLLFADLYMEKMYQKAQKLGLTITAKTKDSAGKIEDTELITSMYVMLMSQKGRSSAAIDLAGYLIALKALENTDLISEFPKDPSFIPVISLLPSIDLGSSPENIWSRSLELVIRNPAFHTLAHVGNISRIP